MSQSRLSISVPSSNQDKPETSARATRFVLLAGGLYLLAGAALWFGDGIGAAVTAAFAQPGQASLLYLALPVTLVASFLFWLGPGLMLTLVLARPRRLTGWIVWGFLAAFAAQMVASTSGKLAGAPLGRLTFLVTSGLIGLGSWVLLWRQRNRISLDFLDEPAAQRRAVLLVLIPVLGLLLLLPFLFWQDLNPDGVEAFAIGDSLARQFLPHSLAESGALRVGTGIIAPAYLYHAFLMFFGPIEAGLRLPFLLLLPVMFCQLIDLIEWNGRRLAPLHELLLLFGLAIYAVVMVFNASYDPYFADISAPTVQETTLLVGMLGVLLGMVRQRPWMMSGFALLACFSRPTGFLFLLLLLGAILVAGRQYRRRWLRQTAVALAICIVAALLYEIVFVRLILGEGGAVAGASSTLRRLRYLTLTDWRRLGFLIFPSGILPALTLFLYWRQDSLSRIVTLITAAFFLFFYITAFVALHHFVVGMVLPLVVFWRVWLAAPARQRRTVVSLAGVGAAIAFWLSLPQHFEVNRDTRALGRQTLFQVGDPADGLGAVESQSGILASIISHDWDVRNPAEEWVGSPLGVVFYAERVGPLSSLHRYAVLPAMADPPGGMVRIDETDEVVLYGRDAEQVRRDRFRPLNDQYLSPLYDLPRQTLFRHWGEPAANYDLDLAALLRLR